MTRAELIAHIATTNTKLDAIHSTLEKMEQHASAQNGRLRKVETVSETTKTRVNILFGIGGSLALAALGWILK